MLWKQRKKTSTSFLFNVAGVGPGDRSIMGNLSTEKYHQKLSLPRVTLPTGASDSANVRQRRPRHETPALDHGRVAARTLGSFHPFWSTKLLGRIVSRIINGTVKPNCKTNCQDWIVSRVVSRNSQVHYSPLVNSSLRPFIKFTTNIQIVKNLSCRKLHCLELCWSCQ